MESIILQDNKSYNKDSFREQLLHRLEPYRKLNDWLGKNAQGRVLVIGDTAKDTDEKSVLYQVNDNKIVTQNYVGVLQLPASAEGESPLRVEIHSRFDSDKNAWFLLYLLSRVYGFRLDLDADIQSHSDSVFDPILCVLFFERLRTAYESGLFKVYRTFRHNDYNFRGTFDVTRHIRLNTPFLGKTAYTTREHTYDNDVLRMIRQTIGHVREKYPTLWENYTRDNTELLEIERVIESATPSFLASAAYQNTELCRREIVHPLFRAYEDVRLLCRRILSDEAENPFHSDTEDSFALLIDMSWLWEEFVSVELVQAIPPQAVNDDRTRYRHLVRGRDSKNLYAPRWYQNYSGEGIGVQYPDFIQNIPEDQAQRRNILDAKYKHWKFNRDDIHQFLTYLYLTGGTACGAIFPVSPEDIKNKETDFEEYHTLNPFPMFYGNTAVNCFKLPFYVPSTSDCASFAAFCGCMETAIDNWRTDQFEKIK